MAKQSAGKTNQRARRAKKALSSEAGTGSRQGSASKQNPGLDDIGARARALRQRQRMTLDTLAEKTGVSKGHLSRFERGEKSLSLAILMRVSDALDASTAELLGQPASPRGFHLARASDRTFQIAQAQRIALAALSHGRDRQINAFITEFGLDAASDKPPEAYHGGEEILFVLSGTLDVELDGQKLRLVEGDYLQFPGSMKHTIRSLKKPSRVLIVIVKN